MNTKSTITFLIKCRNTGITPKFINNSTKNIFNIFKSNEVTSSKINSSLNNIMQNFHFKILKLLIKQKHEIKKFNENQLKEIEYKINKHLNTEEQEAFWNSENTIAQAKNSNIKSRHKRKFDNLREEQRRELNITHNEKWFVNKTNTNIPNDVQWLLSLGQKHAIPTEKQNFPLFKYIADGEDCIQTLENKEDQEVARTKLTSMLENHINKHSLDKRDKYVLNTVGQTRSFLKKNTC